MVPTLAPARRQVKILGQEAWTNRFNQNSASRRNRKTMFLSLASCVFLLPTSLSIQSQAFQSSTKRLDFGTLPGSNKSAQLVSVPSETTPPQTLPQPVSSQTVTPDNLASSSPSQPLSQLKSSSEPAFAEPKSDAQQAITPKISDAAANVAASSASSLTPVTDIAPMPQSAAMPPSPRAVAQHKIRVSAILGGQTRQAQIAVTPKLTVGQALAAMGISLAALDRVSPEASVLARDGMSIHIQRISAQVEKRRTAIPAAELRYQPTTKILPGAKQVVQQAKAGALEITERVWRRDGKITKREFVSKRVAVMPRPKVIALGVKSHLMPGAIAPHRRYAGALAFRGGSPRDRMLAPADPSTFVAVRSLSVESTGYAAGRAGGAIGSRTATGVRCTYGAVAVDPRLIPLGSKMYIEGYGYGFACDTGGAIKGAHIDLAFDSAGAAMKHGRRRVKVWILGQ